MDLLVDHASGSIAIIIELYTMLSASSMVYAMMLAVGGFGLIPFLYIIGRLFLFYIFGIVLHLMTSIYAAYQGFRIMLDISIISSIKFLVFVSSIVVELVYSRLYERNLKRKMDNSKSFTEWQDFCDKLQQYNFRVMGLDTPSDEPPFPSYQSVIDVTTQLRQLRMANDVNGLVHELPSVIKRNFLGIDDVIIHHDIHTKETKAVISQFNEEVCECANYITKLEYTNNSEINTAEKKILFLKRIFRNIGRSALCLSGGGSIAMYHIGVLHALLNDHDANGTVSVPYPPRKHSGDGQEDLSDLPPNHPHCLYDDIHVISGSSGGSIIAGICAMLTPAELLHYVTRNELTTDFRRNGRMKKEGICWFPSLPVQALNFLRTGYLVENKEFMKCCMYYFGDMTFAGILLYEVRRNG